jgi:sugar (pentulose or hexulose) kinase
MAEACGTRVCGGMSDGCSATISCGSCGSGQTCDGTGTCVTTPVCVASACGACGIVQTKCCKSATACGCAYPFAPCL